MNRADKIATLSALMGGNPAPLMQHRSHREHGIIHLIMATLIKVDDRFTNITVGRQPMPDMSRSEFEQWRIALGAKGALVVCMIRPR